MSERRLPAAGPCPAEEGIYLFCLARLPLPLDGMWGLEENRPLAQTVFRDVAAVWCTVCLNDYCGPQAEAHLGAVDWIGPRALRHQQVVEEVMRHAPVLPCRFGTLFSSPAALRAVLETHHFSIVRYLRHVSDKEEWALKLFLDAGRAEAWLRTSDPAFIERESALSKAPGRRYFQEKQLLADVRRQARVWAREEARRLHEELTLWAVAVRSLRLPASSEPGREWLFSSSLLLPRKQVANFRSCVARHNVEHPRRCFTLELSGPWPPYSFSPSLSTSLERTDEIPHLRHPS